MKLIKYILSIILFFGSVISSAQWSIPDGFKAPPPNDEEVYPSVSYSTVKTPHQTSVPVLILTGDWTSGTKTFLVTY